MIAEGNPIRPTVDFDAPGVRHGHLRLPWSRNESAWGNLMIPVCAAVGERPGPTVLVTGGNHGDEYEGPLAALALARELRADAMSGRVLILPFLNFAAVKAGTRVSPVDGVNMNRCFPGSPRGSQTEKVADYVMRALAPLADLAVDFHSGGRTLDFLPFAASHLLDDKALEGACASAAAAFNAPYTMKMLEMDPAGLLDTALEEAGIALVTTELRGGGTATAESVAIARRGLRNVLIHAGVLGGEPERAPSRFLSMPSLDCYSFAGEAGMLEPCVDLGATVRAGDALARVWRLDRTGVAPETVTAALDGVLAARHFPGLVQPGDAVGVVAVLD